MRDLATLILAGVVLLVILGALASVFWPRGETVYRERLGRALHFAIALAMLAVACLMAANSSSAVEAAAGVALVAPVIFWAAWTGSWGWQRTTLGYNEFISSNEAPPSALEKAAAAAWLWLRRIVCAAGALAFGTYATLLAIEGQYFYAAVVYLGAVYAIWHGVIGGSSYGYGGLPQYDLRSYRQRKRRYGWRW